MFWCHNCQKNIQSLQQIKCEYCSCEAIEEITQQSQPQNFEPFVSAQHSQNSHSHAIPSENFGGFFGRSLMEMFSGMTDDSPMMIRYVVYRPVVRIIIFEDEEQRKNPVDQQKYNSFQKVCLQQQCAVCQQKQGNGVKLPCTHAFHENCIKPWFQNTNTCPCCRIAV